MGEVIAGRYEIGIQIGQGGMGTVYQGVDLETGQDVAIKLLRPEVVAHNQNLVERFVREGEALRRLNHPNIVKILAMVNEQDRHYLVMEYVSGGSLQDLLRKIEHMPIDQVLQIGLELADALARTHHLRIIHRDLKPANILLANDGTPRLTDFGIARLSDQSSMTESGLMVGTFSYLSPEACEGRSLDSRTDIWCLGLILFEMLTGFRPFERDQVAGTITAILTQPIPDLAEIRPDVPAELALLIGQMLEKDREKRISSVRQVGATLEAISHGEITPSRVLPNRVVSRFLDQTSINEITPLSPVPLSKTIVESDSNSMHSKYKSRALYILLPIVTLLVILSIIIFSKFSASKIENQIVTPSLTSASLDEYGVLIADLQPVKTEPRDVSRIIVNNLKQQLEIEAPFSKIQIISYPKIITSSVEAQSVAQMTGATVVVWGNYTADEIQVSIQIGSLNLFHYNGFDRSILERSANVQVQLSDETKQSISSEILAIIGVMHLADGNILGYGRTLAALDALNLKDTSVVGNNVAAHIHRYLTTYLTDPGIALDEADAAVKNDANNPLAYALRSQARWRLLAENDAASGVSQVDIADRDALTAQRLGPPNWVTPYTLFRSSSYTYWYSFEQELSNLNLMVDLRPDDWYLRLSRAIVHYQTKDFDRAEVDMDKAIALKPDSAFPYGFAALLALRKGSLIDAANAINTVSKVMPSDPEFLTRLEKALYGNYYGLGGSTFPVFSQLILGQYDDALNSVQASAKAGTLPQQSLLVDLTMLQAVSYCNLGRLSNALHTYNLIIPTNPDYTLLYFLRADTFFQQGENDRAYKDIQKVQSSDQNQLFAPFVKALVDHRFTCRDIFNSDKVMRIIASATQQSVDNTPVDIPTASK